jgi:hypothetical protein
MDHRIAGNHSHQRQNAEDCDEAERPAEDEQRRDNSDEAHRNNA